MRPRSLINRNDGIIVSWKGITRVREHQREQHPGAAEPHARERVAGERAEDEVRHDDHRATIMEFMNHRGKSAFCSTKR